MEKLLRVNHLHYRVVIFNEQASNNIVAFPGLGSTAYSFARLALMMPDYTIYAIDLPGHGKSSKCTYDEQMYPALIDNLHLVIQHLKLKKFDFVAHSYGAQVAILYTQRYKDEVGKCISIDGGYHNSAFMYEYVEKHREQLPMLSISMEEEVEVYRREMDTCIYDNKEALFKDSAELYPLMDELDERCILDLVYPFEGKLKYHLDGESAYQVIHFINSAYPIMEHLDFSNCDISILQATLPLALVELRSMQASNFSKLTGAKIISVENSYHMMHFLEVERVKDLLLEILNR